MKLRALHPKELFEWWRLRGRTKQLRHDSRRLLGETSRILRKYKHRVPEEIARDLLALCGELRAAMRARDVEKMPALLTRLEDKVDRHLAWGKKSAVREWVESVGVAVFVALLLRAFVVEAFKIPSGSMLPTLEIGDHLFVNKFLYGLQVPLTHRKLVHFRSPGRGEIIVFIYPHEESKDFIKRVVAIGGDQIEVRQNRIVLNGSAVARRSLPGRCSYQDRDEYDLTWTVEPCEAYEEGLGGFRYRTIQTPHGSLYRDFPAQVVPEGHVFVMGDNRDNSHDSRFWGTVPLDYIKGKAMFIWWSCGPGSSGPLLCLDGLRWRRLFRGAHATHDDDDVGVVAP